MHSTKTLQYRKEHYIIQEKGYAHTFSCLVNMPQHNIINIIKILNICGMQVSHRNCFYFTVLLVSICQRTY